jgi:hypothetical protein
MSESVRESRRLGHSDMFRTFRWTTKDWNKLRGKLWQERNMLFTSNSLSKYLNWSQPTWSRS